MSFLDMSIELLKLSPTIFHNLQHVESLAENAWQNITSPCESRQLGEMIVLQILR